MLDILNANRAALGVGDGDFATSIEATRANLRSAADLAIEGRRWMRHERAARAGAGDQQHRPQAAHELPSRRIYVHLKVSNPAGTTLLNRAV